MIERLAQYYQVFCNLSLDVVLGVICCMLPLTYCFGVHMPLAWYLALPMCAWTVYLLDHAVDVTRKKEEYPTPRHQFVRKHLRKVIALIALLSIAIFVLALLHFNRLLFYSGLVLGGIVVAHLIVVRINPEKRTWWNNKELAIALLYASGIYIGPVIEAWQQHTLTCTGVAAYAIFSGVTYANLLMASLIEYRHDVMMGNSSMVRVWSEARAGNFFVALCILTATASLALIGFSSTTFAILLGSYVAIAVGHLLVYYYRNSLVEYLAYRKIAEALFWLPAFAYIIFRLHQP